MPRHMNTPSSIGSRPGAAGRRRRSSSRTATPRRLDPVRAALADHARVQRIARTFRALGDPTRSRLVLALSVEPMYPGDLADALGASPSAISHQLRILRELDIVRVRRRGRRQLYALNEGAFGFCAPRICPAWRQSLQGPADRRPAGRR